MVDLTAPAAPSRDLDSTFESVVESFERRRFAGEPVTVAEVAALGPASRRAELACELVRVDLEIASARGERRDLDDYRLAVPELFERPDLLALAAFEEWRLRHEAGEQPSRDEYLRRYKLPASSWPQAARTDQAAGPTLPKAGETFDGMPLEKVLGAGAFSRVFVARQASYGNRQVVLKVTADASIEPQRLGRLQHTNVVPLYSVHRDRGLLGLCMPLLGERTLADLVHGDRRELSDASTVKAAADPTVRRESRSPTRAAGEARRGPLGWREAAALVADLAAGLSHAHERGVVHSDIKPANISIGDDGIARLMDFNLASDAGDADPATLIVGGTLPYLAPEHLDAVASGGAVTQSCDLYSLGVVLYELLAGRRPFVDRHGELSRTLRAMHADRVAGPALLASAPAGVAAIVAKCLDAAPSRRYASAAELEAELRRELADQPLRATRITSYSHRIAKWRRRNRQTVGRVAASLAAIVALAGLLLATTQGRRAESLRRLQAVAEFDRQADVARLHLCVPDADADLVRTGTDAATAALEALDLEQSTAPWVARLEAPLRDRLAGRVDELLALAEGRPGFRSPSSERLAASFVRWPLAAPERTTATTAASIDIAFPAALAALRANDAGSADAMLAEAIASRGGDPAVWVQRGVALARLGDARESHACFTAAIALVPQSSAPWRHRAYLAIDQRRFAEALSDLDRAVELSPEATEPRLNRAVAMVGLQRWRDAADELTAAIALGATRPRAYLLRSRCYDALRDPDKAQADRRRAVSATPIDDQDWAARALALSSGSAERALADIAAGLERYPRSVVLLRNQIHLLGDIQRRERDAAEAATRLLEVLPNDVPALLSRAVCFARLGDPASALRDARRAEAQALRPVDQLQLACVYALVATRDAGQRPRAVKWLREGLSADPSLVRRVAGDSDLASIAGDTDVRELVAAATKLVEARP